MIENERTARRHRSGVLTERFLRIWLAGSKRQMMYKVLPEEGRGHAPKSQRSVLDCGSWTRS